MLTERSFAGLPCSPSQGSSLIKTGTIFAF
jgi:hypothetical protein